MSPATWRSLRWLVALAVSALLIVIIIPLAFNAITSSVEFGGEDAEEGDEGEEENVGELPSGPVEDGAAIAVTDFAVRGEVVRQTADPQLAAAEAGDAIVIAFPLVDGDPECVESAHLHAQLLEGGATKLQVYASDITDPEALEDGQEVGDPRRDEKVWWTAVTDGSPGGLLWNITDLYKAWASGELAPAGTQLVVVVATSEGVPVVLASSEREAQQAPTLSWRGVPDCG